MPHDGSLYQYASYRLALRSRRLSAALRFAGGRSPGKSILRWDDYPNGASRANHCGPGSADPAAHLLRDADDFFGNING